MAVTLDVLWCLLMVHLAARLWTASRSLVLVWYQCLVRSLLDGRGSYADVSAYKTKGSVCLGGDVLYMCAPSEVY